MPRRRKILLALLIPTLLVAAWQWLAPTSPYEKNPDPMAGATIRYVRLKPDHSFHWMHVRLDVAQEDTSSLLLGLALELADGRKLRPAGLELEGQGKGSATENGPHLENLQGLTVQFWLEPKDFEGPMKLRIGDGTLTVRTGSGSTGIPPGDEKIYKHCDW